MSISPSNTVVISTAVTDQGAVCVSLGGDVDLTAEPDLAGLVDSLAEAHCTVVHIDLDAVTFASSSLVNFLARLAGRLPRQATINMCRPGAMTRQLLELTGMDQVTIVGDDLPADWIAPWAAAASPLPMQAAALA
jgi:anti-anti-sigma factor